MACSCGPTLTYLEELEEADAVFAGKVVSIEHREGVTLVTFNASQVWKGPVAQTLLVATNSSSPACGLGWWFEEGKEYLVYAYVYPDAYGTGMCGRTTELEPARKTLEALGEGQIPDPGTTGPGVAERQGKGGSTPPWAIGLIGAAAIVLAGLGVVAIFRRARQT